VPVTLHAATARVVGKADQRTILVRIEVLGVVKLTHTTLKAVDVLSKQLLAFGLCDGCIDAVAVAVGGAVVTVTCIFLALPNENSIQLWKLTNSLVANSVSVKVALESLQFSNEFEGSGVDRGTLFHFSSGQRNSASGEECNGDRGELHIDGIELTWAVWLL